MSIWCVDETNGLMSEPNRTNIKGMVTTAQAAATIPASSSFVMDQHFFDISHAIFLKYSVILQLGSF